MTARNVKRVKFCEEPEEDDDERSTVANLSTVLPVDAPDEEDERQYVADNRGPVKDVNPDVAAKRRAARRHAQAVTEAAETVAASIDMTDDIYDAEEDDPFEMIGYNEAGDPIPLEPFNLTREREEGYFDMDGNYIEYRLQGVSDAWLDGLEQQEKELRAQSKEAALLLQQALLGCAIPEAEVEKLDEEEQAAIKRRIANMLLPGESVLQALRRLANMHVQGTDRPNAQYQAILETSSSRKSRGVKGSKQALRSTRKGSSGDAEWLEISHADDEEDEEGGLVPVENIFTLEQQGQSGERQRLKRQKREQDATLKQQQQQVHNQSLADEPAPAPAPLGDDKRITGIETSGLNISAAVSTKSHSASSEMLSQDTILIRSAGSNIPHDSAKSTSTLLQKLSSPSLLSPRSHVSNVSNGVPVTVPVELAGPSSSFSSPLLTASRRVPAENSIEFEKLTEYADRLLGQSDFDIYTKSREQLLNEAAASDACQKSTTDSDQRQARVSPEATRRVESTNILMDSRGNGDGQSGLSAGPNAQGGGGVAGAKATASQVSSVHPAELASRDSIGHTQTAASTAEDDDMFGIDFEVQLQPAQAAGADSETVPSHQLVDVEGASGILLEHLDFQAGGHQLSAEIDRTVPGQATAVIMAAGSVAKVEQTHDQLVLKDEGRSDGAIGVVLTTEAGSKTEDGDMQGFELDPDSGMYYNSAIGFYFDPSTQRWCDASTGKWYKVQDGQYVAVH